MKPIVIINRGGGSAGDDALDKAREALSAAGIDADVHEVDGGDAPREAKKAVDAGAKMIIAAGGDGTMSAIAGVLAGTDTIMGILPMGTLNHLARDLGISFKLEEASQVLAAGKTKKIDLAEVNGETFVNNSAVGLYPLMVRDREAQQKRQGRSKKVAMMIAAIRTLARFRRHRLSITTGKGSAPVDTPLLFVGNNEYRTDIGAAGQRESICEGRLNVLVLRQTTRLGLFAAAIRSLFNRSRREDLVKLDDVTELRVSSSRSHLSVSLDGEVRQLETPLDYRIRPGALTVIVP